jgi:putative membrane protein
MKSLGHVVVLSLSVAAVVGWLGFGAAAAAPSALDRSFLHAAHELHLAEISSARLALSRSRTDEIRRHAQLFLADHQRLDSDVRAVAKRLAVPLPGTPSRAQQQELAQLSRRSGAGFDAAWLDEQLTLHQQSAQLGRRQVSAGSDPAVVALARRAAPVLQAHLAILQETRSDRPLRAVEGGSGGESNGEPARIAPLGLGLIGLAVVLAAVAMFVVDRRGKA